MQSQKGCFGDDAIYLEDHLKSLSKNNICIIGVVNRKITTGLLIQQSGIPNIFDIYNVCTDTEARGRGYGMGIMKFAIDYCQQNIPNIYALHLDAFIDNNVFYEKAGFVAKRKKNSDGTFMFMYKFL